MSAVRKCCLLSTQYFIHSLKLIDLSSNRIQKEEDLWALRSLHKLSIINLTGNTIMTNFRPKGLLPAQAMLEYPEVYVRSR